MRRASPDRRAEERILSSSARIKLIAVAFACGLYGLFCAIVYVKYFATQPFQDWMVYYTAGRAWLDGDLRLTYDGVRFTAHMNAYFAEWLGRPLSFHPWLYPPTYLFVVIPFALLPFAPACGLFLLASFAGLIAAIWFSLGRGYRPWLHSLSLLLAPASLFAVGSGQNAFLTAALLVGGFGVLPKHPYFAGALLGLLSYKPQFWALAPVALLAAREWRALGATLGTAALFALASAAVFGIEPWRVWVEWVTNAPPDAYQTWLKWGRMHGESIYTNLVLLGASHVAATAGQTAATTLGAGIVCWGYSRDGAADLQLALLLACAILAAPHVTNYDAVMLVVAATILFARGLDEGFRAGGITVPVLVWMVQLFNPPGAFRLGLVTPLLTGLLIVCLITRLRAAPGATALPATSGLARHAASGI